MHDDELTVRRVFTIEYTCRIDRASNARRCHGWVIFRPRPTEALIRRPFRTLSQINEIIEQMLADADDVPNANPGESP